MDDHGQPLGWRDHSKAACESRFRVGGMTTALYRFKTDRVPSDLGSYEHLCRPVVLVDHAAENFAPLDRQVQRRAGLAVVVGWSLLTGLARPVPVVMAGVLAGGLTAGAVRRIRSVHSALRCVPISRRNSSRAVSAAGS